MSYLTIRPSAHDLGAVTSLTGNVGGDVHPDATDTIFVLGTDPITVTGTPLTNTLTITVADASETQKGVLETSTDAESIAGLSSTVAVVPTSLKAKLGAQTAHAVLLGEGTSSALGVVGPLTDGQLVIGSTGVDPVAATLTAGSGIVITNGAGAITIEAPALLVIHYTSVSSAMSPYSTLVTDYYIGANSGVGVVVIRLPDAPVVGRSYVVKDALGSAAVNTIVVTTVSGAVLLDGAISYTMNTNYQSANFLFNGTFYEVY